jgi:hypothetical protein
MDRGTHALPIVLPAHYHPPMAKNGPAGTQTKPLNRSLYAAKAATGRPSALLDTRVVYCGDNLEQLAKLPDACVDLIYIDPPFNSNRAVKQLGEVF